MREICGYKGSLSSELNVCKRRAERYVPPRTHFTGISPARISVWNRFYQTNADIRLGATLTALHAHFIGPFPGMQTFLLELNIYCRSVQKIYNVKLTDFVP